MPTFLVVVGCIVASIAVVCVWGYYKLKSLATRGLVFVAQKQLEALTESVKAEFVSEDLRSRLPALKDRVEALPVVGVFNSGTVLGLVLPLIADLAKLAEEVKAADPSSIPSNDQVLVMDAVVEPKAPLALPPATTSEQTDVAPPSNSDVVIDVKPGTSDGATNG
ncbi:MAG: hypothetical protein K2W95_29930 [Candidatus Obscuribacterales bacterium]|nr:hypothetical protein [Candidatus Obscuribacterales bacterium]